MSPLQRSPVPAGIGTKFSADGAVLPYPGNTVVCALGPDHPAATVTRYLHDHLAASVLAPDLALLPPASHHMTVFDGVLDGVRRPDRWPVDLPIDAPLADVDALFTTLLADFDIDCPLPFALRTRGLRINTSGVGIALEGDTADEERKLRRLRDRLAARLGLHRPGHDDYGFHLTLAYWLRMPAPEAWKQIGDQLETMIARDLPRLELGAPDFCRFTDMHAFPPVLPLRSTAHSA